ncbi:MAG: hypothetical protein D6768_07970 [Chloroflexi bacterium]|nr:MAG: hypothetical protein D6768_07970 [Chloroflexota bacterium]
MSEQWFEITSPNITVQDIENKISRKLAAPNRPPALVNGQSPETIAASLWAEMIGPAPADAVESQVWPLHLRDCDVVPRSYVIDWQIPILGPLNALVRRIINAELRRYLLPALEKQSYLNRQLLRALADLREENNRLRQEIERLQNGQK